MKYAHGTIITPMKSPIKSASNSDWARSEGDKIRYFCHMGCALAFEKCGKAGSKKHNEWLKRFNAKRGV